MKKREVIDTSEILSGSIPSKEVIDELEKTLVKFELAENLNQQREIIDSFYENVKDWEIVLAHPAKHRIWLQGPIRYFEIEQEYSTFERIKAFISKGLLLSEREVIRYADILSNTKFPMELTLPPVHSFIANSSEESKFYYSVFFALRNIEGIMDKMESELAVYKKPAGIVAMNSTVFNINEMNKLSGNKMGELKETIETIPFSDLISKSEVGVLTSFGFEKYEGLERGNRNEQRKLG